MRELQHIRSFVGGDGCRFGIAPYTGRGQFGRIVVAGFAFLPLQDFADMAPRFAQATGAIGHLVLDKPVQLA